MTHELTPKKSLSQNFLRDTSIVTRIAEEGSVTGCDWIIELGAGDGTLTAELARHTQHVIAVEFDRDLIPILLKRFPLSSSVSIETGDMLSLDLPRLLEKRTGRADKPYAVFGNIPYGITGKIIRHLLALDPLPKHILLMMQKEVAQRIVAKEGKHSVLSVAVHLLATSDILFSVPNDAFFPQPNVESAVIRITPDTDAPPLHIRENAVKIAKIGFASKRKTLVNNLASGLQKNKKYIETTLLALNIPINSRAESLDPRTWIALENSLNASPSEPQ